MNRTIAIFPLKVNLRAHFTFSFPNISTNIRISRVQCQIYSTNHRDGGIDSYMIYYTNNLFLMLKPDAKAVQLLTKTTANTLPSIGTKPY